jgi:hypothetical protein
MSSVICVKYGEYRNIPVVNKTFKLVKGYQTGKKGGYVTVKNEGHFPSLDIENIKIKVGGIENIEFVNGEVELDNAIEFKTKIKTKEVKVVAPKESDEEAMDRIATRFAVLDEMSKAAINGDIRAMIVSGPPGVGKSYGVETQLEKASLFDKLAGKRIRYEVVKGAMTALGLYAQLYKLSDRKNVLVFDDCDSVFADDLSLNILKAALDSGKRRRICWNSDSSLLRREGIPDSFDFNGTAIFITNLKFENVKSKKLQDHLEALQSRCHFLDLTINDERDKMLRIKQVHRDAEGGLFKEYDFENNEGEMIIDFMVENQSRLRELSMRMCLKIADLIKISPANWKALTTSTCMKSA